jgi:polysaccharide pyruvyl transferase WcaK-like protein
MLEAFVDALPEQARLNLVILVKDLDVSPRIRSSGAVIRRASARALLKSLWSADRLIQAGGTIFHDDVPDGKYPAYLLKLIKLTFAFWAGRLVGGRVAMVGVGLGPLNRRSSRLVTRLALAACYSVVVRDRPSHELAQRLGRTSALVQSCDLAVLLAKRFARAGRASERRFLSIAPISLAQSSAKGSTDIDRILWGNVVMATGAAMQRDSALQVRIIQMSDSRGMTNDAAIADFVRDGLDEACPGRVSYLPYDDDPERYVEAFATSHAVIAARYHSAIFGYLAACRLLLVGYHSKVLDLADQLGLGPRARLDPRSLPAAPATIETVSLLLGDHPDFDPQLSLDAAYEMALRNMEAIGPCSRGA